MADEIPTAPRFDRYGEIRYIGHVKDKYTRKLWVVIRRKGGDQAFAVTENEWLGFVPDPLNDSAFDPDQDDGR